MGKSVRIGKIESLRLAPITVAGEPTKNCNPLLVVLCSRRERVDDPQMKCVDVLVCYSKTCVFLFKVWWNCKLYHAVHIWSHCCIAHFRSLRPPWTCEKGRPMQDLRPFSINKGFQMPLGSCTFPNIFRLSMSFIKFAILCFATTSFSFGWLPLCASWVSGNGSLRP